MLVTIFSKLVFWRFQRSIFKNLITYLLIDTTRDILYKVSTYVHRIIINLNV